MIFSLLCKLPRWLGGGHKWRRLTKKEWAEKPTQSVPPLPELAEWTRLRRTCSRCHAERVVKARKPKAEQETTT